MSRIVTGSVRSVVPVRPSFAETDRRLQDVENGYSRRCKGRLLALLALGVLFLGLVPAARAELLVYSAVDFVRRCPCGEEADRAEVNNGVLIPVDTNLHFFTSVSFPVNGQNVCKFSLLYHDINANDSLTARLVRKSFTLGGDPFSTPVIMATVSSAGGVPNTVRRVTTTAINSPTIAKERSFYYVEIEAPTINLNVLGVQIDVRQTCP